MISSCFEEPTASYCVLINDEGQLSLWPSSIEIPGGWRIVHDEGSRSACLAYVSKRWSDMRPLSLRDSADEVRPAN